MATSIDHLRSTYLPSNPNFLLDYMARLASDNSNKETMSKISSRMVIIITIAVIIS